MLNHPNFKVPLSTTELINNYMVDFNPSLPMFVIITKNIKKSKF